MSSSINISDRWCSDAPNCKFSQKNEFAGIYSIQSYIFFAHLPILTHDPTQPTKNKNFRPIPKPTQPNPRINPTHGQLWLHYILHNRCPSYLVDLILTLIDGNSGRRIPEQPSWNGHGPNSVNAPSQLVVPTVFLQQSATLTVIQHLDELWSHIPVCFSGITFYHYCSLLTIVMRSRPLSVCMTGHYNTFYHFYHYHYHNF